MILIIFGCEKKFLKFLNRAIADPRSMEAAQIDKFLLKSFFFKLVACVQLEV